jgi:hypothetical protein
VLVTGQASISCVPLLLLLLLLLSAGATACVALVRGDQLYVASVGDSR